MKLSPTPNTDHEVMYDDYHSLVWIEWVEDSPYLHATNRSHVCKATLQEARKRLASIKGEMCCRGASGLRCIVSPDLLPFAKTFGFSPSMHLADGNTMMFQEV